MTIARRKATPEMYVARVIAKMLPRLSRQEKDVIAAGFSSEIDPGLVGDLLRLCRQHKTKPTLPLLDLLGEPRSKRA